MIKDKDNRAETGTRKKPKKWVNWIARISTTFGLALLTYVYLKWAGLIGGVLMLGLLVALSAREFSKISHPKMPRYRRMLIVLLSFFMPYFFHLQLSEDAFPGFTYHAIEGFFLVYILITLLGIRYKRAIETVSKSIIFPVWGIALPLSSLIFIVHLIINEGHSETAGLLWVIVLIFLIKSTDIGALLIGSWLGKRKLAPKTSPGKTIEGAVGGVATTVLVALIMVATIDFEWPNKHALPANFIWVKTLICATLISISGILGDLFESCWKRFNEMKDSGECLPGLGGIYDLTDSIILGAPVSYFMIKYILFF